MGLQVSIPECGVAVVSKAAAELAMALRMVDNLPAFPNEPVPEDFSEIRLAAEGGMISVRNQADGLVLVVWGNADESLRKALVRLAARLAELGAGKVQAAGKNWPVADWVEAGAPLVAD
jgi:hypothetical protein